MDALHGWGEKCCLLNEGVPTAVWPCKYTGLPEILVAKLVKAVMEDKQHVIRHQMSETTTIHGQRKIKTIYQSDCWPSAERQSGSLGLSSCLEGVGAYRLEVRNRTVPEVTEQAEVEHPTRDCFQPGWQWDKSQSENREIHEHSLTAATCLKTQYSLNQPGYYYQRCCWSWRDLQDQSLLASAEVCLCWPHASVNHSSCQG